MRQAPVESLPREVSPQDFRLAREAFEVKYGRRADRIDVLSYLAELFLLRKQPTKAIACFHEIPTTHPTYGRMARFQAGRTLLDVYRVGEAEQQFRELIAAEESSPSIEHQYLIDARQRLRHILEVELRFEERHRMLREVIDRGEDDEFEAVAACFPSMLRWNGPDALAWGRQFHKGDPANTWVQIAAGRYLTGQGKADVARPDLEALVRELPQNLWARTALIACLREAGDVEAADRMISELPPQKEDDPWLLLMQRGSYALQKGDSQTAMAAYGQILRQDRTSTEAWQGVAHASRFLNETARRSKALQMVNAMGRIQNHLGKTTQDAANPKSFLDVADLCIEFELFREGAVMARQARRMAPDDERVRDTVALLKTRLAATGERALLGE